MRYLALLGAVLAAIGGWYLFWSHSADRFVAEANRVVAEQRAAGLDIAHGPLAVKGFPYRLSLEVPALNVHDRRDSQAWRLRGDVQINVQPWQPNHAIGRSANLTLATWPRNGAEPAAAAPFAAQASLVAANGIWDRIVVDARQPRIALPDRAMGAERLRLGLRRTKGEDADRPPGSIEVGVNGEGLSAPPGIIKAFDQPIAKLTTDLVVGGPWPAGTLREKLAAWRDAGGVVQVLSLDLVWAQVTAKGSGTVTLDRQMRPLAALSAEMTGLDTVIDALVTDNRVRRSEGLTAKAALALVSQRGPDGKAVLKVPVSAQDGWLWTGPLRLTPVGPILPPE
jgi:hypothetical protein